MKITLKILDLEVVLEDEKETNREKLIGEGLGCMESLCRSRAALCGDGVDSDNVDDEESSTKG